MYVRSANGDSTFKVLPHILLLTLLAGCDPGEPSAPTDLGPPDFGPQVIGVSPDGTGFCCEPLRGGRSCGSPEFLPGGYTTNPRNCLASISDIIWVSTTLEFVDAHGCVYLDTMTAMNCNTPDLGPADAGPADAAIDDSGP